MATKGFNTTGNGFVGFDTVDFLTISGNESSGSMEFGLNFHTYGGGNAAYGNVATFSSIANLQAALTAFIAQVGEPWFAVGTIADLADVSPQTYEYPIAINVSLIASIQDTGSGMTFNGVQNPYMDSFGYSPFENFASAQAALEPLMADVYNFVGE